MIEQTTQRSERTATCQKENLVARKGIQHGRKRLRNPTEGELEVTEHETKEK